MKRNVVKINGEEFRFYISGCRADYYVSQRGEVYSRSHQRGRIRKRKPDYCGHKYPTMRIKTYENGLVVTKNIPLYRIVYETYVDRMPNWISLGIKYKDGDPCNVSIDNLLPYPRKEDALLASVSSKCGLYEVEYKKYYNRVVDYVKWVSKLTLMDSEDVAEEAYIYASFNYDNSRGDFYGYWISTALRRAKGRYYYGRRIEFDENDFEGQCVSAEDFSVLFKIESLTEAEKWWLSFLLQGYTREDILKKPLMRTRKKKIVLRNLYKKIREVYSHEEL